MNGEDHTNRRDGVREDNTDRAQYISHNDPVVHRGG